VGAVETLKGVNVSLLRARDVANDVRCLVGTGCVIAVALVDGDGQT
jgi:hypothetical protein